MSYLLNKLSIIILNQYRSVAVGIIMLQEGHNLMAQLYFVAGDVVIWDKLSPTNRLKPQMLKEYL